MDREGSMSLKPVTTNTLFYPDNLTAIIRENVNLLLGDDKQL
jgi:hypothetical protein